MQIDFEGGFQKNVTALSILGVDEKAVLKGYDYFKIVYNLSTI
jgi:hypothetical protein